MKQSSKQKVAIVLYQEDKDRREVDNIFNLDTLKLSFTNELSNIPQKIDKQKPVIIIFCLKDMNQAQELMLDIVRNSQFLMLNCQSILLVSTANIKQANRLCMKGIFDDYILFWPNYDIERINFAIHNLLTKKSNNNKNVNANAAIKDLLPSLASSSSEMSKLATDSHLSAADIKQQLDNMLGLINKFDAIDEKISSQLNTEIELIQSYLLKALTGVSNNINNANKTINSAYKTVQNTVSKLGHRLLLIDDDVLFSNMLKVMLKNCNLEVIWASSVQKGIKILSDSPVDLVFLDYNMPDTNGMEGLTMIRQGLSIKDLPIIMITGTSDRQLVENVIAAGANDFIVKPPKKQVILSKLSNHIKGYAANG